MFFIKSNSIKMKLIRIILLSIIIEAILILLTIFSAKTFSKLDNNFINILNLSVKNVSNNLEVSMNSKESGLENDAQHYIDIINDELNNKGVSFNQLVGDQDTIEEMLNKSGQGLLDIIKNINVSGAFIVLDTSTFNIMEDGHLQSRAGVLLRNENPLAASPDDAEIALEYGPTSIAEDLKIKRGINWKYEFCCSLTYELGEISRDYFNRPFLALDTANNLNVKDYGYWSKPFRFNKFDIEVVTYSIPLLDKNGAFYGVIGIELSTEYLKNLIPSEGLMSDIQSTYIISTTNNNNYKFIDDVILNEAQLSKEYLPEAMDSYSFVKVDEKNENLYSIFIEDEDTDIYAVNYPLKIYTERSSFKDEQWSLIGFVKKSDFKIFSAFFTKIIVIIFGISTLISIFFAVYAGSSITKPISKLIKIINQKDISKKYFIEKTNISEIDELASAIEKFSEDLLSSSSKMSKIIDLLDISIATFEVSSNSDKVFVTKSISHLLSLNPAIVINDYIPKKEWEYIYKSLTDAKNFSYDGSYRINTIKDSPKWIKIKTYEKDDKILGVLIDVTNEILERKKLEYERDYDVLTGILNRRAFFALADQVFLEDNVTSGAMAMWDLDGLKYVNDHYGHCFGDKYIQEAARVLDSISNPVRCFVARLSGDEFVTFIFGNEDKSVYRDEIYVLGERLRNTYLALPGGEKIQISASAGITYYPDDADNCKELIKRADYAMYKIKGSTKNGITEFNSSDFNIFENSDVAEDINFNTHKDI